MSNDWWGSPANVSTPPRQNSYTSYNRSGQTPNHRFNDELDAEDARMADGVKFLPSFSTSTAGKLLGGGVGGGGVGGPGSGVTPGSGLGMSSGSGTGGPGSPGGFSPPGMGMSSRRSPNTRFGDARCVQTGNQSSRLTLDSSPRASRMRQVNMMDEDMPPTTSLRDSTDTPTRPMAATPNHE